MGRGSIMNKHLKTILALTTFFVGTLYLLAFFSEQDTKAGQWDNTETGEWCSVSQIIYNEQGKAVSEIMVQKSLEVEVFSMKNSDGHEEIASLVLTFPRSEILRTDNMFFGKHKNIAIKIDDKPAKFYSSNSCSGPSEYPELWECSARIGLSEKDLSELKQSSFITITIVPKSSPTTTVDYKVSLSGFKQGFDNLQKPPFSRFNTWLVEAYVEQKNGDWVTKCEFRKVRPDRYDE
jgi:invasion protein IalB